MHSRRIILFLARAFTALSKFISTAVDWGNLSAAGTTDDWGALTAATTRQDWNI